MQTLLLQTLLLLTGGLVAGALGGLLGIGGGVVLLPLLRFVVHLPPAQAAGTTMVAVLFTTLGGTYRHWKLGHVPLRELGPAVAAGAAATLVCSWAFQWLATRERWLDLGMGLVFALLALRFVRDGLRDPEAPDLGGAAEGQAALPRPGHPGRQAAIGAAGGVLPGLLGIGTGALLVPAFTLLLGAPIKTAIGCSLACFSSNALISASFKAAQGFVAWDLALPLCLGTLGGSNLGALLAHRLAPRLVRVMFGLFFCYVALRFVLSCLTMTA